MLQHKDKPGLDQVHRPLHVPCNMHMSLAGHNPNIDPFRKGSFQSSYILSKSFLIVTDHPLIRKSINSNKDRCVSRRQPPQEFERFDSMVASIILVDGFVGIKDEVMTPASPVSRKCWLFSFFATADC